MDSGKIFAQSVGWRWHADLPLRFRAQTPRWWKRVASQLVHGGFFTIDDCDEEVSGGVSRVCRANRRRRSVGANPAGIHRANSGGHGIALRPMWLRGVGFDVNDPQSQDEDHPHSDESVASSRIGASVAEESECTDQDAEEDAIIAGRL